MCLTRERAPGKELASAAGERAQPRQAEAPPPCLKGSAELDAQPTNDGPRRAAHATRTSARLTCARRGLPPPVGGGGAGRPLRVREGHGNGLLLACSPHFFFFCPPLAETRAFGPPSLAFRTV